MPVKSILKTIRSSKGRIDARSKNKNDKQRRNYSQDYSKALPINLVFPVFQQKTEKHMRLTRNANDAESCKLQTAKNVYDAFRAFRVIVFFTLHICVKPCTAVETLTAKSYYRYSMQPSKHW